MGDVIERPCRFCPGYPPHEEAMCLRRMHTFATDNTDREWAWYPDDVKYLLDRIVELDGDIDDLQQRIAEAREYALHEAERSPGRWSLNGVVYILDGKPGSRVEIGTAKSGPSKAKEPPDPKAQGL